MFVKGEVDPIQIFSTKKTHKHAAKYLPVGAIVRVGVQQVVLCLKRNEPVVTFGEHDKSLREGVRF